jgi:hypothetical protein
MARTLDVRTLNRTLLDRQLLLRRRRADALAVVERLVCMQAQVPRDPYVGLCSRIEGFEPRDLAVALEERRAARMTLLRGTLHLATDRDAVVLRPTLAPVMERLLHTGSPFGRQLEGVDVRSLLHEARTLLEQQPRTRAQLAPLLGERWPGRDATALAYAATYLLPLVQVTPRGIWGRSGSSAFTTVEHWLGRPLGAADVDGLVRRYLTAFGPASAADLANWSGLTATGELLERLQPELRTFRDERGRELFDAAGGRLRAADTPAPVRFLPEYDNVLLSHADRSRVIPEGTPQWTGIGWGSVLIDGFVGARWRLGKDAVVRVEPFSKLTRTTHREVADEGSRLASFLTDGASFDARVVPAGTSASPS